MQEDERGPDAAKTLVPGEDPGDTEVGFPAAIPTSENQGLQPGRIGQYRVLRRIGQGGMGVVFEAEQESPRRKVALKVLRGGSFIDETGARLLQREADTLARLKHPNIATVYESGRTEDGYPFFAMELVQGDSLAGFLEKRGSTASENEVRFRLSLFRKITDTVHYAHQRGVIHRDLKPANIIVTEEGGQDETEIGSKSGIKSRVPEIKILDFGLARIVEGDVNTTTDATEVGQIKGTLAYMAPEQAQGRPEEIDIRTDVYALGVILYEMLTGQRPYSVADTALVEAIRVICEEPPRSLRQSMLGVRGLDRDIETIVNKALEKEAKRRYPSAAALSEDITRYLSSQPILARAPSGFYQLKKFAARNKVLVGGIAATMLVLIAGTAVATLFGFKEAAQRRLAEQARSDLEAVVQFQSGMLDRVDPEAMGRRLIEDLKARVVETRRNRHSSDREIDAAEASFTAAVEGINRASLAQRLIDEEILGRAVKTIEAQFKEQPLIDARLRDSIGETYAALGLYTAAEEQLQRAMETRRSLLGDENPETLLSMKHLSFLFVKQGRYAEGKTLAESTLALHKRVLGEDHRETLAAAYTLGLACSSLDQGDEAERIYKETLAAQKRVLGEDDPDTLNSMEALGVLYKDQGRFGEAEKQHRATLEIRRRVLGPEHAVTMQTLHNLAIVLAIRGNHAEAAKLFAESLDITRRVQGEEHPDTLSMMHNLAIVYTNLKRFAEAESLQLRAIELRRRVLGAEHPDTLDSMNNLSVQYFDRGMKAEAEKIDRAIFAIRLRVLGEEHSDTLVSMNNLGVVCRDSGRYAEAEALFRNALETRKRVSGFAHPMTDQVRSNLSILYSMQGRTAEFLSLEAEKLEAGRIIAERGDATPEQANNYAWQLMTIEQVELRNPRKALEFAQHACAEEEANGGSNLWNYLDTLALAYHLNGDTAAAIETEKKALDLLSPDRPERAGLLQQLAEYETRQAENKGLRQRSSE